MNEKLLLFSRDPGGANTIIPLVGPLEEKGFKVRLFGKDAALEKYAQANLKSFNIMDFMDTVKLSSVEKLLIDEMPNLIITGTSADDLTEKFIWKSAEKLNIPSFAILDQWVNYGVRFSQYGVSQMKNYAEDRTHPYEPFKILVMDETAKNEAISDGLEPSKIIVTGQPYFETVLKKAKSISQQALNQIRDKYDAGAKDFFVTFVSEPISDTYKETDASKHYWGYTERTIFRELLACLQVIADSLEGNIVIVLRLHPKESRTNYNDIVNDFNHNKIAVFIDSDPDPYKVILSSDVIIGMSSMLLIESIILGKTVISVQIGLKRKNPFILDKLGISRTILSRGELTKNLKLMLIKRKFQKYNFRFIENAVENIINLIEISLCRN